MTSAQNPPKPLQLHDAPKASGAQPEMADILYRVVVAVDGLIACDTLDQVYRRAVEFVVKDLGLDRCSIIVEEDGDVMRGTWGVNRFGEIQGEHNALIPISKQLRASFAAGNPGDRPSKVAESTHAEWTGSEYKEFGTGWVVSTPIYSTQRLHGIMFNDNAISKRPYDPALQQVLSVFCSMLGTILGRKSAEMALRTSEERLSGILRDMEEVLWALDAVTHFPVFLSPDIERIFGRSHYEFFEDPALWRDIIHPDDRAEADRFYQEAAQGAKVFATYRILRPDGSMRWLSLSGRRRSGQVDSRPVIEGMAIDITDRRLAENASKVMARRNESLISALGEVVYEHSIATGEIEWGGATLATLGYQPNEMGNDVGSWIRRIHPEDREGTLDRFSMAFDKGTAYDLEYRFQTRVGDYRWVHDRGVPHFGEEGQRDRVIGVMVNIHERKEGEARQQKLEQRMQQAEKLESLGLLAGGVAHDFNNLITGILGNLSLALEELEEGQDIENALVSLRMVKRTGERASELTKQLLVVSGKGTSRFAKSDLSAIVQDMLEIVRSSLGPNIELKTVLSPHMEPIRADPTQVRQIVMNLVTNANDALAATGGGEITVRTGITRINPLRMTEAYIGSDLQAGDFAYLEVTDNGCGIPEDVQARIFDPFFTTKRSGHGLGLASVLGIARAHRGAIAVRSEPGRFTRITVLLPLAD